MPPFWKSSSSLDSQHFFSFTSAAARSSAAAQGAKPGPDFIRSSLCQGEAKASRAGRMWPPMFSGEGAGVLRTGKEIHTTLTCSDRRCETEERQQVYGRLGWEWWRGGDDSWGTLKKGKNKNKLVRPIWVGEVAPQSQWGTETKSNEYVERRR